MNPDDGNTMDYKCGECGTSLAVSGNKTNVFIEITGERVLFRQNTTVYCVECGQKHTCFGMYNLISPLAPRVNTRHIEQHADIVRGTMIGANINTG
jgi:hypothetical protein